MIKLFNPTDLVIVKTQNDKCEIGCITIEKEWFDLPYKEAYQAVINKLIDAIGGRSLEDKKFYLRVFIIDENAIKEDVETVYSFVEIACTEWLTLLLERDREKILGTITVPSGINLTTVNLLKWINHENKCKAFGFEVSKIGSSWKKRMVK